MIDRNSSPRGDCTRLFRAFIALIFLAAADLPGQAVGAAHSTASQTYLLIRSDDAGMSHSVNMALERLIKSGLPVSVSIIMAAPWYQETVEILKRYPNVSVGIHLALNSEWRNYRWGPVAGRSAVPTLVDAEGYFFPSGDALEKNNPDVREVERELRAQIERAMRTGLKIDYVDYHMGTALRTPEFTEVTVRLAREFGLGMSRYFGETMASPQYAAEPSAKTDTLVALVNRLTPGVNVVITHVGIDDAELGALVDMNVEYPLPDMSKHRNGELTALTSPKFRDALKARGVQLITYRDLIAMQGLTAMRPPRG